MELQFLLLGSILLIELIYKKRMDKLCRGYNKKRKYNIVITAILFYIPMGIGVFLIEHFEYISGIIPIYKGFLFAAIFMLISTLNILYFKNAFITINKKKYDNEMAYVKSVRKKWYYYLFIAPASSLQLSVTMPPVNRRFKYNSNELSKYRIKMLDSPSGGVQLLFTVYVYFITSSLLYIVDRFSGYMKGIYFNIYFIPFILMIILCGNSVFGIFKIIELIAKRRIHEYTKFISFIISYVIVAEIIVHHIMMTSK